MHVSSNDDIIHLPFLLGIFRRVADTRDRRALDSTTFGLGLRGREWREREVAARARDLEGRQGDMCISGKSLN